MEQLLKQLVAGQELIFTRLDKMDARFDKMESRLDKIDNRLDKMDDRFNKIENRLDKMDDRFDKIEHRLDKMDDRFDKIENRLDKMDDRFDKVENRLENVSGQLQENTRILHALEHRTEVLGAEFQGLLLNTATKDSVARLEAQIEQIASNQTIQGESVNIIAMRQLQVESEMNVLRKVAFAR